MRFTKEIARRILIKGGNPEEALKTRREIWKGTSYTDAYLTLVEEMKGMEELNSQWDVQTQVTGKNTKHARTIDMPYIQKGIKPITNKITIEKIKHLILQMRPKKIQTSAMKERILQ